MSTATRGRGRCRGTSPAGFLEHVRDLALEPFLPARLRGLGQAGPRCEHVVLTLGNGRKELAPRLAQKTLYAIPGHGSPDGAGHREPQARLAVGVVSPRKPV